MSSYKSSPEGLSLDARKILNRSGIVASLRKNKLDSACDYLVFDLGEPYIDTSNGIHFSINGVNVKEDHMKVEYFRWVAASEEELIRKADLLKTLATIVESQGHRLGYEDFGIKKRPDKAVRITAQIKEEEVDEFADFIGTVDRVMLLYLHPSYKRSTKK